MKEHSLAVLQRQYRESQSNLGLYLDLYQIHSATIESGVLENTKVLAELARLKSEGIAVGLSVSGSRQREVIEQSLNVKVDGVRLFCLRKPGPLGQVRDNRLCHKRLIERG